MRCRIEQHGRYPSEEPALLQDKPSKCRVSNKIHFIASPLAPTSLSPIRVSYLIGRRCLRDVWMRLKTIGKLGYVLWKQLTTCMTFVIPCQNPSLLEDTGVSGNLRYLILIDLSGCSYMSSITRHEKVNLTARSR